MFLILIYVLLYIQIVIYIIDDVESVGRQRQRERSQMTPDTVAVLATLGLCSTDVDSLPNTSLFSRVLSEQQQGQSTHGRFLTSSPPFGDESRFHQNHIA